MIYTPLHDWSGLAGRYIHLRLNGAIADTGKVDTVSEDGTVLWLEGNGVYARRLYAKAEQYEAVTGPGAFNPCPPPPGRARQQTEITDSQK